MIGYKTWAERNAELQRRLKGEIEKMIDELDELRTDAWDWQDTEDTGAVVNISDIIDHLFAATELLEKGKEKGKGKGNG